jgi:hypothetical protein
MIGDEETALEALTIRRRKSVIGQAKRNAAEEMTCWNLRGQEITALIRPEG